MRPFLVLGVGIALVAGQAPFGQVRVLLQERCIHQVALVVVFLPDRRRRTRSPFSLGVDLGWDDQ